MALGCAAVGKPWLPCTRPSRAQPSLGAIRNANEQRAEARELQIGEKEDAPLQTSVRDFLRSLLGRRIASRPWHGPMMYRW